MSMNREILLKNTPKNLKEISYCGENHPESVRNLKKKMTQITKEMR